MKNKHIPFIEEFTLYRQDIYGFLRGLLNLEKELLLSSEISQALDNQASSMDPEGFPSTQVAREFANAQEALVHAPWVALSVRSESAQWSYYLLHAEEVSCRAVEVSEFLNFKERIVAPDPSLQKQEDEWELEINFRPFRDVFPTQPNINAIGDGFARSNEEWSSVYMKDSNEWKSRFFSFLDSHCFHETPLLINHRIQNCDDLKEALTQGKKLLQTQGNVEEVKMDLPEWLEIGLEPGWGRELSQVSTQFDRCLRLIQEPDPETLSDFLGEIPSLFHIVILSPHGYFGQSNVLGMPDTGGQVVYILDQVRTLEKRMREEIHCSGLGVEPRITVVTRLIPNAGETSCNQYIEPIIGTENSEILRVPFRNAGGEIEPDWITRFQIWPYLETFATEVEKELRSREDREPDLIIGNYSDGSLVATLLSRKFKVPQCDIAHALEKTKYLHSDLFWKDHEAERRFSAQYTADLISMNAADFVIASAHQEIAGSTSSVGQYESYQAFSLPGLYRVVDGIDPLDARFNLNPPGANNEVFFPYDQEELRSTLLRQDVRDMIMGRARPDAFGVLENPEKPIVFAMSRLDEIKNLAGLVEWYASSKELREESNLFIVGGQFDPERSKDSEEREQIRRIHAVLESEEMKGCYRWLVMQTDKNIVGEIYRFVADLRGVFVQPALFEAFGLTVIEAMSSGLPVFATCYGGPLEIIEEGVSGFHIDPNLGPRNADRIAVFLKDCRNDSQKWKEISSGALKRIEENYNWDLYSRRLLKMTRIYRFWKDFTLEKREPLNGYLDLLYGLVYRPRALQETI